MTGRDSGGSAGIGGRFRTQQVTEVDLGNGRIRIPSSNTADTKRLFPGAKAQVSVSLRGVVLDCAWDPRMGPDRQRSGVLRIGSRLRDLVRPGEVLTVTRDEAGIISIE